MSATALVAAFAAPLAAQDDPARVIGDTVQQQLRLEVTSRLASTDPKTVAWGAWLAAKHRVDGVGPQLLAALRALPAAPLRVHAAQNVLDALVVLEVEATAEDLEGFDRGRHAAAALVVYSRDPKASATRLREIYDDGIERRRRSRWLAAGNLLAAAEDREFARARLGELRCRLEVVVRDPDDHTVSGMGGAFGGRFADGRYTLPKGLPPAVRYTLVEQPRRGDVVFAAGQRPVLYRRVVHEGPKVPTGSGEVLAPRPDQAQRVAWLAAFHGRGAPHLDEVTTVHVAWTDAEALQKEVTVARARLDVACRGIARFAQNAGLVDVDDPRDAALLPAVEVHVDDRRAEPRVALPEIR